jgi:hypothetical protein
MSKATDSTTPIPTRRALLAGAPAAAAGALLAGTAVNAVAITMAKAGEVDPVFAAIEREREAFAAYCASSDFTHRIGEGRPPRGRHKAHAAWWVRQREADRAHEESAQNLWSARVDFLETQPTTVAGLLAYLNHIEGPLSTGDAGEAFWDEQEKEAAFPTLAAAARKLIGEVQA